MPGSSKPAELVATLMPKAGIDSHPAAIHDACAVGFLLWPELFRLERGTLRVVTGPGPAEGRTLWTPDERGRIALSSSLAGMPFSGAWRNASPGVRRPEMALAVVGSINCDVIAYVERLPRPGETLAHRPIGLAWAAKAPTRRWPPGALAALSA